MARPKKTTIEYFPHDVDASARKTLVILESRWGNDGYAFWFKLLEILGSREGMYIEANNPAELMFLAAKTGVSAPEIRQSAPEIIKEILDCLAELGAICPSLWNVGVIFSEGLVDRTKDAFRKRAGKHPQKEGLWRRFGLICDVSAPENPKKEGKPSEETGKGKGKGKGKEKTIEEIPYHGIVDAYNKFCPSFPRARELTIKRKQAIKLRWLKYKDHPGGPLTVFDALFKKAEASDFVSGRNGKWSGAGIDWLLNESNMVKVIEGNYDNKNQVAETSEGDDDLYREALKRHGVL